MTAAMPASGQQFTLHAGRYRAEIASVGASLRTLTFDGRDLVLPWHADEVRPSYRGAVLAPWPNRVVNGHWHWRGEGLQLALNEPDRGHALHGLVTWLDWRTASAHESAVVLATDVIPVPGYPFRLALSVQWSLAADGLRCGLRARNTGSMSAPYGAGLHPYLVAPGGSLDHWILHVPAHSEMLTDEGKAPTVLVAVTDEHDFRLPRPIGHATIDHAYTDIALDETGRAAVTLTDTSGLGARMEFDRAVGWVQVCTSDWPGEPGHRAGVAVEPMTCPPNAFATGTDLVVLEPGDEHELECRIAAVEPPSQP